MYAFISICGMLLQVTAYDVSGKVKGALFRVPVSVIIPHE